jgi:hypothetical protein
MSRVYSLKVPSLGRLEVVHCEHVTRCRACDGAHRHPALVEQFTVLEGTLSIFLSGPTHR